MYTSYSLGTYFHLLWKQELARQQVWPLLKEYVANSTVGNIFISFVTRKSFLTNFLHFVVNECSRCLYYFSIILCRCQEFLKCREKFNRCEYRHSDLFHMLVKILHIKHYLQIVTIKTSLENISFSVNQQPSILIIKSLHIFNNGLMVPSTTINIYF